ncbi:hypothetical protein ACJX0J_036693 [Zea mays]
MGSSEGHKKSMLSGLRLGASHIQLGIMYIYLILYAFRLNYYDINMKIVNIFFIMPSMNLVMLNKNFSISFVGGKIDENLGSNPIEPYVDYFFWICVLGKRTC